MAIIKIVVQLYACSLKCPDNYSQEEITTKSLVPYCVEDGSGCEKCHNQKYQIWEE